MITQEELRNGLELMNNGEEFIMTSKTFGKVELTREGDEIVIYLGKMLVWCDSVELGHRDLIASKNHQVIALIPFEDVEVA